MEDLPKMRAMVGSADGIELPVGISLGDVDGMMLLDGAADRLIDGSILPFGDPLGSEEGT
jgi:hypothetical protein